MSCKWIFILLVTLNSGCAALRPFSPQPGMTIDEVSSAAYIPCDGDMNPKANQLVLIGRHPELKNIEIYRTVADYKYNRGAPECRKDLYFQDGKLVSIDELKRVNNQSDSDVKSSESVTNTNASSDVIKKLNLSSNNKDIEILRTEVTANCVAQVEKVYKISQLNHKSSKNIENAERFLSHSKYKENQGMHQTYDLIKKSNPNWYKFQNDYFSMVGVTKNSLIKFVEEEPTSSNVLSECISSLAALEEVGKKKMLQISLNTMGTEISDSNEFCSVFESDGVKKYAEKLRELNTYAINPLTIEKINLINKQSGSFVDLNIIVMELMYNGLTINSENNSFKDTLRKDIAFDESGYKKWLSEINGKVKGKLDYSDPDAIRKKSSMKNNSEKIRKVVEKFSNDCSLKWKESENNLNVIFFFNPNKSGYSRDNAEREKTLYAGLFSGAREELNQQGFRKADFIDKLIQSVETNYEVSSRSRDNSLAMPNNCSDFLASKKLVVQDSGLQASVKPNNKLRKVSGKLIELNDTVGLIQGNKIINYRTLDAVNDASGALLKISNKTKWYVNKNELILNSSYIKAYGKYIENHSQNYTNAFNRTQTVKIPVIDAMCIESEFN